MLHVNMSKLKLTVKMKETVKMNAVIRSFTEEHFDLFRDCHILEIRLVTCL